MSFETINWDAEAKRVARAFGIREECQMYQISADLFRKIRRTDRKELPFSYGSGKRIKYFMVGKNILIKFWLDNTLITAYDYADDSNLTLQLVKALFHLNLLTPEVEQELKVTITAHQKLEWALEFEA